MNKLVPGVHLPTLRDNCDPTGETLRKRMIPASIGKHIFSHCRRPIRATVGDAYHFTPRTAMRQPFKQTLLKKRPEHRGDGLFLIPGKNPEGNVCRFALAGIVRYHRVPLTTV